MEGHINMQSSQTVCALMRRFTPSFRLAYVHSRPQLSTDRNPSRCSICSCALCGEELRGLQAPVRKLQKTHILHPSSRYFTSASRALVRSSNDANGAGTLESTRRSCMGNQYCREGRLT